MEADPSTFLANRTRSSLFSLFFAIIVTDRNVDKAQSMDYTQPNRTMFSSIGLSETSSAEMTNRLVFVFVLFCFFIALLLFLLLTSSLFNQSTNHRCRHFPSSHRCVHPSLPLLSLFMLQSTKSICIQFICISLSISPVLVRLNKKVKGKRPSHSPFISRPRTSNFCTLFIQGSVISDRVLRSRVSVPYGCCCCLVMKKKKRLV